MSAYKTYSDQELAAFLTEGDEAAFAEIYNRYWGLLYRHARQMAKDDELAKDVVQDVFVSLWDNANRVQFNYSLTSYLYSAVRNKILNLYDKEKVKSNYIASLVKFMKEGENLTDHLLRERLLSDKIEQEIAQLPKKMRKIFEMSRKAHMSYKEIADDLSLSDKTVKKQVSNAIKILRLKLGALMCLTLVIFW